MTLAPALLTGELELWLRVISSLKLNEEPQRQSLQMKMALSLFAPDLPVFLFILLLCSFAL